MLVVPAACPFSECAVISVASMSIVKDSGAPCSSQNRALARACAPRTASNNPGVEAIRSTIRNAVESDATDPNNGSCSRTTPRSDTHTRRRQRASPPDRGSPDPGRNPRCRCLTRARRADSALVSPTLSAISPSSALPACDTKPAPSAVTSTVTWRPSRITLKAKPPSSGSGPSASP